MQNNQKTTKKVKYETRNTHKDASGAPTSHSESMGVEDGAGKLKSLSRCSLINKMLVQTEYCSFHYTTDTQQLQLQLL